MPFSIGIAGCGVAGLTAALLLARQGHRVTIFEQAPRLGPVGAGVLLQPTGQLVLEALGLLQPAVANAEPIDRLSAFTHRGKSLIDLPYAELAPGTRAHGILRSDLFSVLHDAATAAGVQVQTATRVDRSTRQPDGVYFHATSGQSHGPFDFLLAADGARSVLRQNAHLPGHAKAYPHGALWTTGPCTAVANRLWQVCRGTRELCGILPTGQRRASLFWSARTADMDRLRARGLDAWRSDVLALCPEAAEILQPLQSFEQVQFVSYMHVHLRKPFDDRCLFLGDAAHAMSPHLGQGINLALIDGYCFAHALAATGNFSQACTLYHQQRAPHHRAYRIITYFLSPFFQSRGVVKGWGRDLFLPLMPKLPFLRRQMLLTMSGHRRSLLGGKWTLPSIQLPSYPKPLVP